jgi:acyl carrier protein
MNDPLAELFAEVLGVDVAKLDDDSSPDNVKEWDSLAAMNLVSAIEERFNVQLSTRDILKMSTIGRARENLRGRNVVV